MSLDLTSLSQGDAVRAPEPANAHTTNMAPTAQALPDGPGSYFSTAQAPLDEQRSTRDPTITDDVLDVEGAAQLLRIGRNTIYELVGRNEIPHRRLGKQIRFSRAAIMRWLDPWSSQDAKEGQ